MNSSEIDIRKAQEILENLWNNIIQKIPHEKLKKVSFIEDSQLLSDIRSIIRGKMKSFKYALLTQVLAKLVNPSINALALQRQANIPGAFDARSFCKKVVVDFERKFLRSVLGGSSDPYVSKPLRRAVISLDVIKHIKDKNGWTRLYNILKRVEEVNDRKFTEKILCQILVEIRKMLIEVEMDKKVPIAASSISTLELKQIISEFLSKPSEGARPQVIVYALIRVLNRKTNAFNIIRSAKSTVPDEYAGRLADIECLDNSGNLKVGIAVTEELSIQKLREELDKAAKRNIRRLIIVAHKIKLHPDNMYDLIEYYEKEHNMDIVINDLTNFILLLTTLLNNEMRIQFLEEVREVLIELEYSEHLVDWFNILKKRGLFGDVS
ncbi:MAG: restriction endonuclease, SacI family [Candidatus Baldrarchaeia archaeon]